MWDGATRANDRATSIIMGHHVVGHDIVVKCVWPELKRKSCAIEHSAQGMAYGLIWPFGRSVLVRRITTSWSGNVAVKEDECRDLFVVRKFASLVHATILRGAY
jgi:hypothetical protein